MAVSLVISKPQEHWVRIISSNFCSRDQAVTPPPFYPGNTNEVCFLNLKHSFP